MSSKEEIELLFSIELKTCTARDLKKAYAKKIKIHSPEKDPEMFQVIRKAYESGLGVLQDLNAEVDKGDGVHLEQEKGGERPVNSDFQSIDSNVGGLIRCFQNGLPEQAISYLNEMERESYHIDLAKCSSTIAAVTSYLYSVDDASNWYSEVVSRFISLFRLDNEDNDSFLAYVSMKNWCHHFGWSREEYQLRSDFRRRSFQWWGKLCDVYREEGESEAIRSVDAFIHSNIAEPVGILDEWFDIFLDHIDQLFPKTLPWDLVAHIETLMDSRIDMSMSRFEGGMNHLALRKAAYVEVEEYRRAATFRSESAYGLACRVILGMNSLLPGFSNKKIHILNNIFTIRQELSLLSKAAIKYETIDQGDWLEIDKIQEDIHNQRLKDFSVDSKLLEKNYLILTWFVKAAVAFSIAFLLGCVAYLVGLFDDYAPDVDFLEFIYLEVILVILVSLMGLLYAIKRFVKPMILFHRYSLYLSEARRHKFYVVFIPLTIVMEVGIFSVFKSDGMLIFATLLFFSSLLYLGVSRSLTLIVLSSIVTLVANFVVNRLFNNDTDQTYFGLSIIFWLVYLSSHLVRGFLANLFSSGWMPAYIGWIVTSFLLGLVFVVTLNIVQATN